MGAAEALKVDVFFDYLCPYVYRASLLLDSVRRSGSREIDVRWRYFSLTQVNSKDDGGTVWGAPPSEAVKGRHAFAAAEAARRQGGFEAFHPALLQARHLDRLDIDDPEVIDNVARAAGLDVARLERDLADPRILDALASDHKLAVSDLGVFGTPTLVFADGAAAYVKLARSVEGESATEVFDRLVSVAAGEPVILEIKRPHKPT